MKGYTLKLMQSYALGYWHGRESGCEQNPYDPESYPEMAQAYHMGYDAGVSDYCFEAHPEEVNQ